MTDTLGLLLTVQVQPADVQDGHGGVDVMLNAVGKYPSIKSSSPTQPMSAAVQPRSSSAPASMWRSCVAPMTLPVADGKARDFRS